MNGTTSFGHAYVNSSGLQEEITNTISSNVLMIIEAITSLLLMIGNGYVIALIQKGKLLGRSTNVFVFSIASADLLNATVSIPSHILSNAYQGQISIYMCKSFTFGLYISKTIVQYTILFMTMEKAMRILCPTREIITVARCMFCTSLLWFFAPSFNIWCVIFYTIEGNKRHVPIVIFDTTSLSRCVLKPRFEYLHIYFLSIDVIVLFVAPCCSVIVIFLILVRKFFTVLKERIQTYFFVIKLLLALFTVAFVCHLPVETIFILDNIKSVKSQKWTLLVNCAICFSFTRGIWNVFIYLYFRHFFSKKRHLATIRASNNARKSLFRMTSLNSKLRKSRHKEQ